MTLGIALCARCHVPICGCSDADWQGKRRSLSHKLGQEAQHVLNVPASAQQDQGASHGEPQGLLGGLPAGGFNDFHRS